MIDQSKFYDEHPALVPWPELLKKRGLFCLYKPREIYWKEQLEFLNFKKGKKLLEVGCGRGIFTERIVKHFKVKAIGVDISKNSIDYANKFKTGNDLKFIRASACTLPFKDNTFDYVVSFDVLEHIKDQNKAVSEIIRVLKPGGKFSIYTLNKKYRYSLDWLWEKFGIDIYARAGHQRELLVDPLDVAKWAKKSKAVKITKITYFDAFFTLFLDELIMVFVLLSSRNNNKMIGYFFLSFTSFISKTFYSVLTFLEKPWIKKGYSLSFTIIGEKNG